MKIYLQKFRAFVSAATLGFLVQNCASIPQNSGPLPKGYLNKSYEGTPNPQELKKLERELTRATRAGIALDQPGIEWTLTLVTGALIEGRLKSLAQKNHENPESAVKKIQSAKMNFLDKTCFEAKLNTIFGIEWARQPKLWKLRLSQVDKVSTGILSWSKGIPTFEVDGSITWWTNDGEVCFQQTLAPDQGFMIQIIPQTHNDTLREMKLEWILKEVDS